jgi:anti-anti-sigma factor
LEIGNKDGVSERQEVWDTDFAITEGDLDARACVIEPHGEVDILTVPELEDALCRAHGKRHVIVDLTDVRLIDGCGLHVLRAAQERIAIDGGFLITICPDRNLRKVFSLMELVDLLNVVDTRRDAVMLVDEFVTAA